MLVDRPDKQGRVADPARCTCARCSSAPDVELDAGRGADARLHRRRPRQPRATRRRWWPRGARRDAVDAGRLHRGRRAHRRRPGEEEPACSTRSEREVVAYHEMGHALVALALPGSDPVHKVSIIPRGIGALGYTIQRPTEDRFLMTREELEQQDGGAAGRARRRARRFRRGVHRRRG
ncbi:MAG: hypothetical protein MZW92_13180 [Comamonadaceae bacterium]|nr:hypothetical protein [Comamonadaceae bacterium]